MKTKLLQKKAKETSYTSAELKEFLNKEIEIAKKSTSVDALLTIAEAIKNNSIKITN